MTTRITLSPAGVAELELVLAIQMRWRERTMHEHGVPLLCELLRCC